MHTAIKKRNNYTAASLKELDNKKSSAYRLREIDLVCVFPVSIAPVN